MLLLGEVLKYPSLEFLVGAARTRPGQDQVRLPPPHYSERGKEEIYQYCCVVCQILMFLESVRLFEHLDHINVDWTTEGGWGGGAVN